jgi:hypothetical protein
MGEIVLFEPRVRYGVWFYLDMTWAFFAVVMTAAQRARVEAAGAAFKARTSVEVQLVPMAQAITNFAEQTEEEGMTYLYDEEIGEADLHELFGMMLQMRGDLTEELTVAELLEFMARETRDSLCWSRGRRS